MVFTKLSSEMMQYSAPREGWRRWGPGEGEGGVIELPNRNHVIRLVHSHDSTVTRPRLNR